MEAARPQSRLLGASPICPAPSFLRSFASNPCAVHSLYCDSDANNLASDHEDAAAPFVAFARIDPLCKTLSLNCACAVQQRRQCSYIISQDSGVIRTAKFSSFVFELYQSRRNIQGSLYIAPTYYTTQVNDRRTIPLRIACRRTRILS